MLKSADVNSHPEDPRKGYWSSEVKTIKEAKSLLIVKTRNGHSYCLFALTLN
jgi:hypothetical protein